MSEAEPCIGIFTASRSARARAEPLPSRSGTRRLRPKIERTSQAFSRAVGQLVHVFFDAGVGLVVCINDLLRIVARNAHALRQPERADHVSNPEVDDLRL